MRLWHDSILHLLPKSQLISQWRELNSIYKKQDNHILINYIYQYPKSCLYDYSLKVIKELQSRGYKINKWDNFKNYFTQEDIEDYEEFSMRNLPLIFAEHDDEYLRICFYNLKEKYMRRQKDFDGEIYNRLFLYIKSKGVI